MGKCHSCMKKTDDLFCNICTKRLFEGVKVGPLEFDKSIYRTGDGKLVKGMSISGVQDKISVRLENGKLVPTERNGQYIVKPIPSKDLIYKEDIPANEHICMSISEKIFNINTADRAVIPFENGELAYITKRFDYVRDDVKLDKEDFASLMEVDTAQDNTKKYDSSYEACGRMITRFIGAHLIAKDDFFRRIVLNYLLCNADAHLKNFALFRPDLVAETKHMMSPNYDVLNTRYHIHNEEADTGLELFENVDESSLFSVGYYCKDDFEKLAGRFDMKVPRLASFYKAINGSVGKVEKLLEDSFLSERGKSEIFEMYKERVRVVNYSKYH